MYKLLLALLLLLPLTDAVKITEIMYNPEGNDKGYEWIEVYNNGEDVNLCEYVFYENEINHKIKAQDCTLSKGEYALIAAVAENLDYDCKIFDSSWGSLLNKGEEICIKSNSEAVVDCVDYSLYLDGAIEGMSLQLGDDWCHSQPTPGKKNNCGSYSEQHQDNKSKQEVESLEHQSNQYITDNISKQELKQNQTNQDIEKIKQLEQKISELELKLENQSNNYQEHQATGLVVYKSKTEQAIILPLLILLSVSILLNVFLIIYSLKRG